MSTAEFNSADIIRMCGKKLQYIETLRSQHWESWKRDYVTRVNSGFFHKLFRLKDVTLEDAEVAGRESDGWLDPWRDIHVWLYRECEERVRSILKLANESDRIQLTDEDYRRIS